MSPSSGMQDRWLVVVTGWTGTGKSTLANALADRIGATVASFDWVMSALRVHPEVWTTIENPPEHQRRVGWDLLSRIAEQQLRRNHSCILDLVAREQPRQEWAKLADRYRASFAVIECICSDEQQHRRRIETRERAIPGWYELDWESVERGRRLYIPLDEPKVVIDSIEPLDENLTTVIHHLDSRSSAAS
jgi:predicted kinase